MRTEQLLDAFGEAFKAGQLEADLGHAEGEDHRHFLLLAACRVAQGDVDAGDVVVAVVATRLGGPFSEVGAVLLIGLLVHDLGKDDAPLEALDGGSGRVAVQKDK